MSKRKTSVDDANFNFEIYDRNIQRYFDLTAVRQRCLIEGDDRRAAIILQEMQEIDIPFTIIEEGEEINGVRQETADPKLLLNLHRKVLDHYWTNVENSMGVSETPHPPVLAEMITRLVTKPKLRDFVLGDRAEQFQAHVRLRGSRNARLFYWTDTLKSCWPAVRGLAKWFIAGDVLRRLLGP